MSLLNGSSSEPSSSKTSPKTSVAFLGPLGTYSHQAASDFFGPSIDLQPVPRISDVFDCVSKSETKYGVVPIENSSIGPVTETMDELRNTKLSLRGMTALKIGHALLGLRRNDEEERTVKKVYSHEQGIGQCTGYLGRYYPEAQVIPVDSTARAAELAAKDEQALAICSIKCADVYGLDIIDRDIQDGGASNTTRFVVLSLPDTPLDPLYPVVKPSLTANGVPTRS